MSAGLAASSMSGQAPAQQTKPPVEAPGKPQQQALAPPQSKQEKPPDKEALLAAIRQVESSGRQRHKSSIYDKRCSLWRTRHRSLCSFALNHERTYI